MYTITTHTSVEKNDAISSSKKRFILFLSIVKHDCSFDIRRVMSIDVYNSCRRVTNLKYLDVRRRVEYLISTHHSVYQ